MRKRCWPAILAAAAGMVIGLAPTLRAETAPTTPPAAAVVVPVQTVGERPTEELLNLLKKNMQGQRTIQAEFRQEKKLKALNHTMKLRGVFAVERPNRIVCHITEPVRYSVLLQNDSMRQWDEDSDRVQTIRFSGNPAVKAAMEQFQAWFLGNYEVVANSYDVTVTQAQSLGMRFVPREKNSAAAKLVSRIDIIFTPDLNYLQSLVLQDGNGDTTTMIFESVRFNEQLPADVWEIPPRAR